MPRRIIALIPEGSAKAIGVLCGGLALYGAYSTPGLIERFGFSFAGVVLVIAWLAAAGLAVPLARTVPSRWFAAGLVAVALAFRALVALCFNDRIPSGDAAAYVRIAERLLHGGGLQFHEPYIGLTFQALYPPLYPVALTAWIALAGASTVSLIALNAAIDGATAWLLYMLGKRIGREDVGRSAAWLYVIWPSVLMSAPLAQKEGLCNLLILALAVAWLRAIDTGAARWTAVATIGALTGMLALTQPGEAPLGALFGLALIPLSSVRAILAIGLRAIPFAVAVMLPWWLRNAIVFGAFVPLTSAGPISLWIGNNPGATGNWLPPPVAAPGATELGYGRQAGAVAREWIAQHPAEFVRLTATKFVRALGVGQFGVERLALMMPHPSPALTALWMPLAQGTHLAILTGSAIALGSRYRRLASALVLLIAACWAQTALFGVWFEFGERHRAFLTPLLLLAASSALPERRVRLGERLTGARSAADIPVAGTP